MTMATAIGAVSSEAAEWYAIDWQAIQRNVRRLQVRIAQATKVGRWGKVRALQRLLTHSYSGKVLAVRRVTENNGEKTTGVNQEIWDTPEKKTQAVHAFQRRGYQPQPLRSAYILKSDKKKMRPLGIPIHERSKPLHLIRLWQWARRRHPTKSPKWLKQKYFEQHGGRNWAFGESCDNEGNPHKVRLLLASSTPIQRHVKVKSAANPYDPAHETYFEKREGDYMAGTFRGTRTLRFLWRFQRGVCPVCNTKITRITHERRLATRTTHSIPPFVCLPVNPC
jgi:hypothetical protein